MMDECAKGHTRVETEHYWRVAYGQGVYPALPKGSHGQRASGNAEVQIGHVKHMLRQLKVDAKCVKKNLPQLRF
jgi:hypothetical protein